MQRNEEVGAEIAKLLAAFPAQDSDDLPMALRVDAYFEALEGIPVWAVRQARVAVIQGRVNNINRNFAPTPPKLAEIARNSVHPEHAERIQRMLPEPDIERSLAVLAGFEELKREMGEREFRWHDEPVEALQKRATANGVDFQTAMDAIKDADEAKAGTFQKLRGAT